jgi:hypothetical protein
VPRARRNKKVKTGAHLHEFNSRSLDMTDINKIFRYSAMKSIANFTPEYSTLKPETSSDSPSAKSKGVRLVSASLIVSQVKDIGIANCILNTN